jgi:hypothetical protein
MGDKMTEEKPVRLRKAGHIERPGPSVIILSGSDEKRRRRLWERLDE